MTDTYAVPPAPGAERVTTRELDRRVNIQYGLFLADMGGGYPEDWAWRQHPFFAPLQATCLCHSLIVVHWYGDPGDLGRSHGYAVLDLTTDGPAGALGADITTGFGCYADAARFVCDHLASEPENRGE